MAEVNNNTINEFNIDEENTMLINNMALFQQLVQQQQQKQQQQQQPQQQDSQQTQSDLNLFLEPGHNNKKNTTITTQDQDMTQSQTTVLEYDTEMFIMEMEGFPCLWNTSTRSHHDQNMRTTAWETLSKMFGKPGELFYVFYFPRTFFSGQHRLNAEM